MFSDAYGRRLSFFASLTGFALASFACAIAQTYEWLMIARCTQGLMAGAPVIARALVRDATSRQQGAQIMTMQGTILTVTTLFAPVLGSGLLILFSWRAIFVALTLLSLAFLAYCFLLLEPLSERRRPDRFVLRFLIQSTFYLLSHKRFLFPTLIAGFVFGVYASLGALGAIIVKNSFLVTPEAFRGLFAIAILMNLLGSLVASRLLRRRSLLTVRAISTGVLALLIVALVAISSAEPSLQAFGLTICVYVFDFGMIMPTSIAASLEPAADMSAFAASLFGSCTMGTAFLGTVVASRLYDGDHQAISITMAFFGAAAVLISIIEHLLPWRLTK